jgi:hypothetical protein
LYKSKLSAFIEWQITDARVKQRELDLYKQAASANKKKRSKKTVELKVIDADTYKTYCEERAKKEQEKKEQAAIRAAKKREAANR